MPRGQQRCPICREVIRREANCSEANGSEANCRATHCHGTAHQGATIRCPSCGYDSTDESGAIDLAYDREPLELNGYVIDEHILIEAEADYDDDEGLYDEDEEDDGEPVEDLYSEMEKFLR